MISAPVSAQSFAPTQWIYLSWEFVVCNISIWMLEFSTKFPFPKVNIDYEWHAIVMMSHLNCINFVLYHQNHLIEIKLNICNELKFVCKMQKFLIAGNVNDSLFLLLFHFRFFFFALYKISRNDCTLQLNLHPVKSSSFRFRCAESAKSTKVIII